MSAIRLFTGWWARGDLSKYPQSYAQHGYLPDWSPQFIQRVIDQDDLSFTCFTNCEPKGLPECSRIQFVRMSLEEHAQRAADVSGVDTSAKAGGGLGSVDLRPLYASMYPDLIGDCEFWGWCDFDIVLGRLATFLTPETKKTYDAFTSWRRPSTTSFYGAFALLKNRTDLNRLWDCRRYRETLSGRFCGALAGHFSPLLFGMQRKGGIRIALPAPEYCGECTHITEDGRLMANDTELLYFHFRGGKARRKKRQWPPALQVEKP